MLSPLFSLLSLATIALACYALGRPVIRGLGVGQEDRLSIAVWSVSVGLVVAGTLLAVLGLVGALYVPLIGALSVIGGCWGIGQLLSDCSLASREPTVTALPAPDPSPKAPWPAPPAWVHRAVLLAAAAACLGALIAALAPPTAGDALCYHLELPRQFLADHALGYLPYSENSTYPLLTEIWYLWGLALDGGVAAQLVHWGLGVLLGLATVVLATPIVGRPWAWTAGALVVLAPGVNNQMTAPLNDVALAVCTTLALAAWWRAVIGGEGRRWFLLAGLAAGGALGVKYLAGVFALAVAGTALWTFGRDRHRRRLLLEGAAIVTVVAISVGGLWYVRAAWHRGNPVYPFLTEVFENDPQAAEDHKTLPASKSPLGRSPVGALSAPWQVTMHPARFGGRGHQLGVLWLVAVPGVLWTRRLRGLGTLLAVASVYFVFWYVLRQNVRFLFPLVPLLSVAVAWVWIEIRRFSMLPRLAAATAFAGIVAAYTLVPLARCRGELPVAFGLQSREDYLSRHEPTYLAAQATRASVGQDAHLLTQDYRAFYFPCRVTRENVYRRRTHYERTLDDPADLACTLRQAGFTHLLLAENLADRGIRYDATLWQLVEAAQGAGAGDCFLPLAEYQFADADGGVRHYRLLMLR
jgi:hypothetical protein